MYCTYTYALYYIILYYIIYTIIYNIYLDVGTRSSSTSSLGFAAISIFARSCSVTESKGGK